MTVKDVTERLRGSGVINAGQESLWLLSYALGMTNAEILARAEFSREESRRIDEIISRRVKGEPLQYILGEADFYGRDFHVGDGVLIPRHDTETLIEGVKRIFPNDETFCFADWGTGSGCLAVTILLEFPKSKGQMIEISPDALRYARDNASRYGVDDRLCVSGTFDLIVSNPPYIPTSEINGLMREVRDFEPITALDGGDDGMKFYREVMTFAERTLKRGGYVILEMGSLSQVEEVGKLSDEFFVDGKIFDDGNFPRCLILRRF